MAALKRRGFIKLVAAGSGGLALGVYLGGCSGAERWPEKQAGSLQPNAFLEITPDGEVIFQLHKAEMGQGTATGLSTLVAEELGIDPQQITIKHAPVLEAYGSMMTGGSNSMSGSFERLRRVGAAARQMLLQAGAAQTGKAMTALELRDGRLLAAGDDTGLGMGQLAALAANQPLPDEDSLALRPAAEFRFIGRESLRVDGLEKVTGRANYGIDQGMSGMATAAILRCPHFGGSLRSFSADRAEAMPGVRRVLRVEQTVVVLADGYWQARQALQQVDVEWDTGPLAGFDDAQLRAEQKALLDADDGRELREDGELPALDQRWLSVDYHAPFMAHAAMEPLCCVADVREDGADIYVGTQVADMAQGDVARAADLDKDRVNIHNTYLGGGFGRRLSNEFILEAVAVSRAAGEPVKVQWSREDDMRHDNYRPASAVRFRALVEDGRVRGVTAHLVAPSIIAGMVSTMGANMAPSWTPDFVFGMAANLIDGFDPTGPEGIDSTDYAFAGYRVNYTPHSVGVPVGFWRSVGHSQNGFFMEGFVDELAVASGADPVEFRRRHLPDASPRRRVLDRVAKIAQWGQTSSGVFQGVAVHEAFGSKVAQVAEVSVTGTSISVNKVYCVIDCGLAVNPDVVRMQMESGIIFGLSAALKDAITLNDGAVQQSNFHDYQVLRMHEAPEIVVEIIESEETPTGVGEPGVPPIAAAVANAVFAATGQRLREMPLRLS